MKKGFTLIELLVVIAILSILLVIVLVAINPARQTQSARNTQRRADVLTMLNAVNEYFVANGSFPTGTPAAGAAAVDIKSSAGGTGQAFCDALVTIFIAGLPIDPSDTNTKWDKSLANPCTDYDTGYTIQISATNDRVTIAAPESLNDGETTVVSVTR
jgi:type IV pilus assembly protein PilA